MKYRLNRKSLERAKSFVRAGQYVPALVAPPVLEDPPNWSDYMQAFLGIRFDKPDDDTETGYEDQNAPHVDWYEYPFSDGTQLGEKNLLTIKAKASAAGEMDIADACQQLLGLIAAKAADQKAIDRNKPGRHAPARMSGDERDIRFGGGAAGVKAAVRGGNNQRKLPRIYGIAYTGVAMELDGFEHPLVIDNTGWDFTGKSRPILKDHAPEKPVGSTTSVQLVAQDVQFEGIANGSGPWRDEVVEAGKNDFPWQVSVGAKVLAAEFLPKGKTALVNGQTFEGPKIISRKTRLKEISILSLGADDDSAARIAARAAGTGSMKLKKKFAAWMRSKGVNPAQAAADDGLLSALKAQYESSMKCKADDDTDEDYDPADDAGDGDDAGDKPARKPAQSRAQLADILARGRNAGGKRGKGADNDEPDDADEDDDAPIDLKAIVGEINKEVRASALAEHRRLAKINKIADSYRGRVDGEKVADLQAKAIGGEITEDKFDLELLRSARPEVKNVYANSGRGSDVTGAIIAAACARGNGMSEKIAYEGLDERNANIAAGLKGMSLHRIISAVAPMIGMTAVAGGISESFIVDFIAKDKASHQRQVADWESQTGMAYASGAGGGGFSTMSLTGITENILYKAMLEMYKLQASVVPDICYERDTQDFKPFKVYLLTASGDLSPVGPAGEIGSISLQDSSFQNQLSIQAALLVLTYQNIVNDDMGALQQSGQILARKSTLSREKAVMSQFLALPSTLATGPSVGKPANTFNFFSAGAANYLSGPSSALAIASLTTAVTKFLQQKDDNGDPIMMIPDRLLVCPELKAVAENLFNGANLTVAALTAPASAGGTAAAQAAAQVPNLNQHKGMYRPLVSPYLGGASPLAGASATQWGLLTNPAGGSAVLQVGYLRGARTPTVRQVELEASRLGIGFQVKYVFGVAPLDWRCGVYSAGQ
jgi:hypothetical protein